METVPIQEVKEEGYMSEGELINTPPNIFLDAHKKKVFEESFENAVNMNDPLIIKQGKMLQKTIQHQFRGIFEEKLNLDPISNDYLPKIPNHHENA
jgi:hypothetical protein